MAILEVKALKKVYSPRFKGQPVTALNGVDFSVESGEFLAVMGESGSGKTTLLNMIAALDRPTSGEILLEGINLAAIGERQLSAFRRDNLGFVFQDFNLLDTFSIRDNILLPLVLAGRSHLEMESRLKPVANRLGITETLNRFPYEVSGGQKQRAAVARAIITQPKLILADEPTGLLDSKAADGLMKLFADINGDGQTIIMVTHSIKAASHAKRVLFIRDGELFHQIYRGAMSTDAFYQKISDALSIMQTGGGGQ